MHLLNQDPFVFDENIVITSVSVTKEFPGYVSSMYLEDDEGRDIEVFNPEGVKEGRFKVEID